MVKQVTDSECGVDGDELTCRRRVCRETEDGIRWAWGKLGRASFPLGKEDSKEQLRRRVSLVDVCKCLRVTALGLT
jgi:hypothetical protein